MEWFAVRCLFEFGRGRQLFEERITLWHADAFESAIARAEEEAREYAAQLGDRYLGLAQAFKLFAPPEDGAEVFSLLRESDLDAHAYLDTFFDTGQERQLEI